jgi:predicted transposase/invertase (TIGR01784 family)
MEKQIETNGILPVKSDVVFRLFFADERNVEFLIGFLKSVLQLSADDYEQIEILDPHLLREYAGDKLGIIDVKLRTKSGKTVHIEVQLSVTPEMRNRIVFYDAKLVTEQMGSGDDYDTIKKVISIVILDKELIPDSQRYHHRFTFFDPEAAVELTDIIEIHTLELTKLPQDPDGSVLYDWASFIAAERKEDLEMIAERNPEVGKAVVKLIELSGDERARALYDAREKERRDESSRTKWAVKQAVKQDRFEIARSMLGEKMSIDVIMKITGLSSEEVLGLKNAN